MTYRMDLEKIRAMAFRKGMSISKVCEVAGLSRSRAVHWKTRGVYPKTVFKVAQVLGADPLDIVMEAGDVEG